ncbi:MAG: flagellar hook-length control protein FliK [Eubacterium sp.]|nr:flagellar hook-length control protein FliK [Eubacterium sp.]
MNLGNIFKRDSQNVKLNDAARAIVPMSKGERLYRMQSEIRNLAPGQTIQGTVVSRDGTSVQIALNQDMLINARIDQSINLMLGQNMSFEVKVNSGSVLSLSPLYANMANEATVMRALSAAGLPETANNIEMVAVMMEEGMPIDKESLGNMSRLLMEFPTQNPASLIQMTRLGIPVTENNIEQFEMYQNANHQLLGSAETVMNELPNVFHELMGEGKMEQVYAFLENVLDIFTGDETEGIVVQKEEGQTQTADGTVVVKATQETQDVQNGQNMASAVKDVVAESALDLTETSTTDGLVKQSVQQDIQQNAYQNIQQGAQQSAVLTEKQWNALGDMLKELGEDEHTAEQIKSGELPPKEVLSLIKEFIPKAGADHLHERMMERLLDGKEFETLLKSEVGRQWLIEPKDVADPHKVEELYERVREQSARLNEALQAAGKTDVPMAKSAQNIQNNIDFMNQMNHVFTYVQLPLKMLDNNAHGDLYVYTNKKNLAAKDGNVSALLHLDMEHLGPLDVYVTMQQNKVSTNFTLQDESALDLIEQHISLLDERLAKRGYDLKAQFKVKEEEEEQGSGIMNTILNHEKNISVLSRTSFDMRA